MSRPRDHPGVGSDTLLPLDRPPLHRAIAERILSHVVQSELVPGDRLPSERELARRLAVSRTSVRQAIAVLAEQGVVEVRHGGGTYLAPLDPDAEPYVSVRLRRRRLPEVHEARRVLEVPLARLAAERRTAADLAAIDRALTTMTEEVARGAVGADGDAAFHAAIAAAAHNPVLVGLLAHLADAITETRSESLAQPGRPTTSLADHRRIADAVHAGDRAAAGAAMEAHLDHVADIALLRWEAPAP